MRLFFSLFDDAATTISVRDGNTTSRVWAIDDALLWFSRQTTETWARPTSSVCPLAAVSPVPWLLCVWEPTRRRH